MANGLPAESGFDLLDLESVEEGEGVLMQLQSILYWGMTMPTNSAARLYAAGSSIGLVDVVAEVIPDRADNHIAFLIDQNRRFIFLIGLRN